jgi:hypothetical protein
MRKRKSESEGKQTTLRGNEMSALFNTDNCDFTADQIASANAYAEKLIAESGVDENDSDYADVVKSATDRASDAVT